MATVRIRASSGITRTLAGVPFVEGVAEQVDTDSAAYGLFERLGYTVEPAEATETDVGQRFTDPPTETLPGGDSTEPPNGDTGESTTTTVANGANGGNEGDTGSGSGGTPPLEKPKYQSATVPELLAYAQSLTPPVELPADSSKNDVWNAIKEAEKTTDAAAR